LAPGILVGPIWVGRNPSYYYSGGGFQGPQLAFNGVLVGGFLNLLLGFTFKGEGETQILLRVNRVSSSTKIGVTDLIFLAFKGNCYEFWVNITQRGLVQTGIFQGLLDLFLFRGPKALQNFSRR